MAKLIGIPLGAPEEAKPKVTSDSGSAPNDAALESAPESERWDPVPGSTGHKVRAASSEDEDDEGRSENEQLVDEGIARAEDDKVVQATRAAASAERRDTKPL